MKERMRTTTISGHALVAACGGVLALGADGAVAQEETSDEVRGTIRVDVTGSHIKRTESEGALPLQVVTREEIANAGIQTAQELLERVSANQSFGSFNPTFGIGSLLTGYTAASLRGLGSERTLVLLNGHRLAPYALSGGDAVDLSGIPLSAIERVEILKDGASATYGADAIGGVINFILRKDFSGVELNGDYYSTDHPGGDSHRANATLGFGTLAGDRYNAFLSVDYFRQHSLAARQREFSRTANLPSLGRVVSNPATIPANILQSNPFTRETWGFSGLHNPTIPFPGGPTQASCLPPFSFPAIDFPDICVFDAPSVVDAIPDAEKFNAVGRLTWQATATDQAFVEATYYRGRFVQRIAPTPVQSPVLGNDFTLPPSSPFYPAPYVASLPGGDPTQRLEILYRTLELGPRVDENVADQWTAVAGMQGTRGGWDYQWSANWARNQQKGSLVSGYVDATRLAPLFQSGVVNAFGFNTPEVVSRLQATQVTGPVHDNVASNYGADFTFSRDAFALSAGPLAIAAGVEGRRESLEQLRTDLLASGNVIGASEIASIPAAHRTVWAAFAESNVPLLKNLEADLAVRFDHYSDFGSTTNPKLSLRWQPARSIVLRGAYGTGFRAPTLSELFQPVGEGQPAFGSDPIRCPATQSPFDCNTLFRAVDGGNPALQPERSKQLSTGVVIEPAAGLSASLDYYRAEVRDIVQFVDENAIFDNYAALAPSLIVRAPPEAQFPHLPGPIELVKRLPVNIVALKTSGIDVDARYRAPGTPIGRFTLSMSGTYVLDYEISGLDNTPFPGGAGQRGPFTGAISRWRHYATIDWTLGPWAATLANNFQLGYSEPCLVDFDGNSLDATGCLTRRVDPYSIWDAQLRYSGLANTTLTFGVRNLFDTSPPLTNQTDAFQVGYDPTYADPRGRTFYAAIRLAFK